MTELSQIIESAEKIKSQIDEIRTTIQLPIPEDAKLEALDLLTRMCLINTTQIELNARLVQSDLEEGQS